MIPESSKILIVDDNSMGYQILCDLLEPEGYVLAYAKDGPEALSIAFELLPDVILLDVMMPGMDGFEVCRRLRNDKRLAEVPILMVTALDDRSSRLNGIDAGADDFISKPFDRVELRARIRTIARLNRYRKLREDQTRLESAFIELQQTHEATLYGWVKAIDLRDKETEGHSQRVVELTLRLAQAIGIEGETLRHIQYGALLHDVGKLGIPDTILLKQGKLTDEEWIIMRRHPEYANEWLSNIPFLSMTVVDIPFEHHEKWDGTGYPRRLKGEQISIGTRLFALADVYDALRSDRPYRTAWSVEKTLAHIKANSGAHFDPEVVKLFLGLMVC